MAGDALEKALLDLVEAKVRSMDAERRIAQPTPTAPPVEIHVRYLLIPLFCRITGYTEKAVRRKIQDGKWIEGRHYRKAPDGHITMDLQAYYRWVAEGI
ncbi:hypothetical protein [Noviherbaspirillum aridicola]|uniref:Excisionase n=1 Tax=Noviherbaspirillum aridicola TaxID=2849687 RepID=A0ABQ4Q9Y5_9BURK|nr:hypothetical protein [Noviherbaspirillum aridicola]GIZ54044.1 hypothetical protein NCCP691_40580 [Noviherbaspirillum aridicola]